MKKNKPAALGIDTMRLFYAVAVLIVLWGIALRSVELIGGNFLFGHDHGRDYLAAYSIAVNHKLTLIGAEAGSGVAGINGIFHGPGYFYLITLAFILFHGNPFGAQLFMALFGVAALGTAGYIGYKIFGKIGGLLFLLFTAVSPLIVSQSRFIWSSHPITVFVLVTLYCVYRIPARPRMYGPLAAFFAGFTYNSQLGVAVPLTLAVVIAIPLIYRIRDVRVYIYTALALLLAYLPMLLFEARHGFMAAHSAWTYVLSGGSGGSLFETKRLVFHLTDYWNNFLNTFTFEFGWIPNSVQKLILYAAIPFVLTGLCTYTTPVHKKNIVFLLLVVSVTCVGYLFLNNTVWDYYLTHTRVAYIALFTYGLLPFTRGPYKTIFRKVALGVSIIFLTALTVGSVFRMVISYTIDVRDNGVYDKIIGKRLVIDTIYSDARGAPFSVFVFMPSVYTWPYDYLFKTYGKQKYGYEPYQKKEGLVYLVIEPDISQPWRQKGWLETVVQGGNVVWQRTLLNGLILMKKEF